MSTRLNPFSISTLSLLLNVCAASAAAQGSISGTVFDSLSTRGPLANATVVLVERARYATTDANGHFRIDSVQDGHYTIGFMHPVLDSLELQAPLIPVDVTGGRSANVSLFTPGPALTYALVCPGPRDTDTGVIIGRVRDADDQSSIAAAVVGTEWTEFTITGGRSTGHRAQATARANNEGVFLLCGVPKEVPVDVRAEAGGFMAGPIPLMPDDRLVRHLDFAISRRDSAARTSAADSVRPVAETPSGSASLHGVVRGEDGRPMREATISVFGTSRSAHTDASGNFRIDRIPAGTRTIEVRSIGLLPNTFTMHFATNASRDTTLSVRRQAQDLAAVAVKERASSTAAIDNGGFEKRMRQGLGTFVTAQDLLKQAPVDLTAAIQRIRGISIIPDRWGNTMPYLRGTRSATCIPNWFVDGQQVRVSGPAAPAQFPFTDLSGSVRPEAILGIEVYGSPGNIPAQYDLMSSTGCGSIVIWTR
jgi:hypothetical protein